MSIVSAVVLISSLSLSVAGQIPSRTSQTEAARADSSLGGGPIRSKSSELSIATQDVVGNPGAVLPLRIKLVRGRDVVVDAIKLLGLPLGTTISDTRNVISTTSDHDVVDITAWDLSKIEITRIEDHQKSDFTLAVAAIWSATAGDPVEVTSSRFKVKIAGDADDNGSLLEATSSLSDRAGIQNPEISPSNSPVSVVGDRSEPAADVYVPDVRVGPLPAPVAVIRPTAAGIGGEALPPDIEPAANRAPAVPPPPTSQADPLIERAKGLIRLGDISGARLVLERAQQRKVPNATYLLAQTWDPAMLRAWKVRGLRADPDLARSLYAKASEQARPDERLLAATGR
jgi:hypothetical protein